MQNQKVHKNRWELYWWPVDWAEVRFDDLHAQYGRLLDGCTWDKGEGASAYRPKELFTDVWSSKMAARRHGR